MSHDRKVEGLIPTSVLYCYVNRAAHYKKNLCFPPTSGFQMGAIQCGIGSCGDVDYPTLAVRLDDPRVLCFIRSVTGGKKDVDGEGENYFV